MKKKSVQPVRYKMVDNVQGWLSVLPVLIIILAISAYPIVFGIAKSFTNWDGLYRSKFIGLRNYEKILTRPQFWQLLSNNCILLLFLPFQLFFGLVVSMLLYEEIPGTKFYRACYYLPQVLSSLSIGYLFAILFGMNGPINAVCMSLGIMKEPVYWLGSRATALFVIMFVMVWINIGWQGMLFLGAMTQISPEIFEAARIDGAGELSMFVRIAVPLSAPIIAVMALYYAVARWNSYFDGLLYVSKKAYEPLQVILRRILVLNQSALDNAMQSGNGQEAALQIKRRNLAEGMKYALVFISSLPMLIVYPFIQKFFVKGIMVGAIKS